MIDETPSGAHKQVAVKRIPLRYPDTCRLCGTALAARTEALYERSTKTVRCITCPAPGTDTTDGALGQETAGPKPVEHTDHGTAGSSARQQYERRRATHEQRLRQKWGRFAGIAITLSGERRSTRAWAIGAVGEELLGARLDALASDHIAVLHDRQIPGSRANIDHMVVTPAAIWVIDAKHYQGQRPTSKIVGGILRPRTEKMLVGRRDRTHLVDGVLQQIDHVREVVGDIPVIGALCFVQADWPWIGGAFKSRGVHVLWPNRLAKLLTQTHDGPVDVLAVRDLLASRFQPAVRAR